MKPMLRGVVFVSTSRHWIKRALPSALLVVTEWREFRDLDFDSTRAAMRQPLVFDGHNLLS